MTEEVKSGQVMKAVEALDLALWKLYVAMGKTGIEVTWHLTIEMKGANPPEKLCQDAPGRDETST